MAVDKHAMNKLILLNLILLFITQLGSIVLANFDAPYGFLRDLTTWISSFIGLSPIILGYLVLRKNYIDKKVIFAYIIFLFTLAFLTYHAERSLFQGFRSPKYKPTFLNFLFGCILSAVISLVTLPTAIINLKEVYLTYTYDIPLGFSNLIILWAIILFSKKLREL